MLLQCAFEKVTMEFESQSAAFVVTLEEGGVFTTCSLDTIDSDVYASENWSQMSSAFNASPQVEEDFGALNRFSLTKVEDIRLSHTSAAEVRSYLYCRSRACRFFKNFNAFLFLQLSYPCS